VIYKTPDGWAEIKNDFCTHIIEFAFSPCHHIDQFERLFNHVQKVRETIHDRLNLEIILGGLLPKVPVRTLLNSPKEEGLKRARITLDRPLPDSPYSVQFYPAITCSTQIHIQFPEEEFYPLLPALYRYE